MTVEFKATPPFTKAASALLTPDERREVEKILDENPTKGPVIKGSGGLRKARMKYRGRGASHGLRICYYFPAHINTIYLIALYVKADQEDLGPAEIRAFAELIRKIKKLEREKSDGQN